MHQPTPNDIRRKAVRLYRKGFSLRTVGEMFGLSHNAVLRYVREAGVPRRTRGTQFVVTPPVAEIRRLMARFGSMEQVAQICGVARGTIKRRLRDGDPPSRLGDRGAPI